MVFSLCYFHVLFFNTVVDTSRARFVIAIPGWLSTPRSTPTILARDLVAPAHSNQNLANLHRHHCHQKDRLGSLSAVSVGSEAVVVGPQGPFFPPIVLGLTASGCRCFARLGSSEINLF